MAMKKVTVVKTTSKPKLTEKDKAAGKAKAAAAKSKQTSGVNSLLGKNDPTGRPYTQATAKKKLAYDEYKKKTNIPR